MHTEVQPRQGLVHVPLEKVCKSLYGGLLGMSFVSTNAEYVFVSTFTLLVGIRKCRWTVKILLSHFLERI